jgi:hypothetical protein
LRIEARTRHPHRRRTTRAPNGDIEMIDLVMLAIGLGFFALSIGYVLACDRL